MTEQIEERFTRQDRDTIIRLDVKMDNIITAVEELKDNTICRVKDVEDDVKGVKKRLGVIENWKTGIIAIGGVFSIVITLVVYIYFSNLNDIRKDLEEHAKVSSENNKMLKN
jgi:hypothetical protein